MNTFQAHELAAANIIREKTARLAEGYAKPDELSAARVSILLEALEQELREQGSKAVISAEFTLTKVGYQQEI